MQTIYGITQDNGDGSCSIIWVGNKELLDKLLDEDYQPETYGINEGGPSEILTFPDDLDLKACGFDIYTALDEDGDLC